MLRNILFKRYQSTNQAILNKFKFEQINSTSYIKNILNQVDADNFEKKELLINGWIEKKPSKVKKDLFQTKLRDNQGNLLTVIGNKEQLKGIQVEDCLQIKGNLKLRADKLFSNEDIENFELKLNYLKVLNKVDSPVPSYTTTLESPDLIQEKYRFLQLRTPKYAKMLQTRSKLKNVVRNYLEDELDFIEVETPLLFKSTPEGAQEYLVQYDDDVSNKSNLYYALPQSPQQFKQLLMGSGVSKYYQFAKCFRNETLRKDRQPEFTQLDMEISFGTGKEVMEIVGEVVNKCWRTYYGSKKPLFTLGSNNKVITVEKESDIKRLNYADVMAKYGSDKPDLRIPIKLINMKEFGAKAGLTNPVFNNFEIIHLPNLIKNENDLKSIKTWLLNKEHYLDQSRKPIIHGILTQHDLDYWNEAFADVANIESPKLVSRSLNMKIGDVIIGSDREADNFVFENPTPLGKMRNILYQSDLPLLNDYLNKNYPKLKEDIVSWIVNFPMFSPVVNSEVKRIQGYPNYNVGSVEATHHPFTMCQLDHIPLLQKQLVNDIKLHELLFIKSQHYDLVINGIEVGGGSTRIHDHDLQSKIFAKLLNISLERQTELFGHLLDAFKMGCPPHSGFAIGWDRFLSILLNEKTIREVIPFPKNNKGVDMLFGSPSKIEKS
ncbi:hypothetical protein HANVADRAFT_52492 [Hanseniaspora valbyensis NRRL Y-1626]|uniref:Aminoacyl-transfer RNA synthetases class-II family profile domain-containing protein n=1 Tax=Hanseniaspora valbyensis NRRL Y-1626 TaxID=766949 RepID=A0A1B7TEN6_9ASCO|nr:hypothetical protein HANVADRAFT_52492 [Hanseniaspora valbyensis NRRL Y-1626]